MFKERFCLDLVSTYWRFCLSSSFLLQYSVVTNHHYPSENLTIVIESISRISRTRAWTTNHLLATWSVRHKIISHGNGIKLLLLYPDYPAWVGPEMSTSHLTYWKCVLDFFFFLNHNCSRNHDLCQIRDTTSWPRKFCDSTNKANSQVKSLLCNFFFFFWTVCFLAI